MGDKLEVQEQMASNGGIGRGRSMQECSAY